MAPPTTATTFLGGVTAVPPAIIEGIGTTFGPFVAHFAETQLKAFVSGYQHNPLATMTLTTCLYILVSNSSLVDSLPEKITGLVTSSIDIWQTGDVALEVSTWAMIHMFLPRRPQIMLAGSDKSPYLSSGKDKDGNRGFGLLGASHRKKKQKSVVQDPSETKYYSCKNNIWTPRGLPVRWYLGTKSV
ncbi:hypothetical protein PG996_011397 [Apiospora saccharicola]|uniref:Uncharacterized protein n=1 Tax=Apiospora saccharicola TaxID=335842 RepID=A0ABR1UEX3_9PEZI